MLCIVIVVLVLTIAAPPPSILFPLPPFILIATAPDCLAVLGIYDGNDNHVPSLFFSPSPPSYSPHASASCVAPSSFFFAFEFA